MEYQLSKLIYVISSAIEDLQELFELAGRPLAPHQVFDCGYLVLSKHRIFRSNIRKWLRRATVDQVWPELKTFLLEVHQ